MAWLEKLTVASDGAADLVRAGKLEEAEVAAGSSRGARLAKSTGTRPAAKKNANRKALEMVQAPPENNAPAGGAFLAHQ